MGTAVNDRTAACRDHGGHSSSPRSVVIKPYVAHAPSRRARESAPVQPDLPRAFCTPCGRPTYFLEPAASTRRFARGSPWSSAWSAKSAKPQSAVAANVADKDRRAGPAFLRERHVWVSDADGPSSGLRLSRLQPSIGRIAREHWEPGLPREPKLRLVWHFRDLPAPTSGVTNAADCLSLCFQVPPSSWFLSQKQRN